MPERIRGVVLDMDGVLIRGDRALPGAPEAVDRLREQGRIVSFVTNNSIRHRRDHCAKLRRLGFEANEGEIVSSASATALYLKQSRPDGIGRVFVIGEDGLAEELREAGAHVVEGSDGVDFVVVGMDRWFTYAKLARAQQAIFGGARFIATNTDPVFPTEHGFDPGGGTMVAALETAVRRPPDAIVGKPHTLGLEVMLGQMGLAPAEVAIVGDQLSTDIVAGNRAGLTTILVLTGISTREEGERAEGDMRPDVVAKTVVEAVAWILSPPSAPAE